MSHLTLGWKEFRKSYIFLVYFSAIFECANDKMTTIKNRLNTSKDIRVSPLNAEKFYMKIPLYCTKKKKSSKFLKFSLERFTNFP